MLLKAETGRLIARAALQRRKGLPTAFASFIPVQWAVISDFKYATWEITAPKIPIRVTNHQ
ncbi:hypothetical protein [Aneurinibacillus migulanus]|uniref:hypothetical protein n=1 Tax=Aneurinibacillus migulanus TaxID=47500 RepID=UPI00116DB227|nr:hypothetical protein [Aneurinibacillus migulanus]GED13387.1 hypothetical protein AMI01nite_13780 [Aneurinibacillus migulanus]